MNSEIGKSGFHARLAEVIGAEEPFAWAKRAGIPSATFDRIWNGRTIPKSDHLIRIAEFSGVTLDWLVLGKGEANSPPSTTDHRLLGRLVDGIAKVFKEAGQAAALHQMTERAALYHDRIVAQVADPDDRLVEAGAVLAELRAELKAAAQDPTTNKRSA